MVSDERCVLTVVTDFTDWANQEGGSERHDPHRLNTSALKVLPMIFPSSMNVLDHMKYIPPWHWTHLDVEHYCNKVKPKLPRCLFLHLWAIYIQSIHWTWASYCHCLGKSNAHTVWPFPGMSRNNPSAGRMFWVMELARCWSRRREASDIFESTLDVLTVQRKRDSV